ncbi:MAG: two-component system, chemotaxis family, protein-glutamate methylesterase/glutaminase [Solirubrobacteraceae bacterium]|jgi:two-component system chemotaxis response regulator CheB|nr:two-component system, chemotaxis family, protein-glutamate methylesterase/glutaminase [Solirubrobacteraceae bacterium]
MEAAAGAPAPDAVAVVALVASAGGLDAVSHVLGALPRSFAAAVVVLIHQAPDRVSELAALLDRRSALPVVAAHQGSALEAGRVTVAPPGRHLLVTPAMRCALIVSGAAPPSRPSADLLLTTLAIAAGPRAITVVLSGGGHDGATGATAIHAFGGTVVATDEASSSSFSMPQAAIKRDDGVDHVVALDDVAPLLISLVGAPTLEAPRP